MKKGLVVAAMTLCIGSIFSIAASAEEIEIPMLRNITTGISTISIDSNRINGWSKINDNWYYLNHEGVVQTGWINDNGLWYYCDSLGVMAHDTVVDGYRLNSSGILI